MKNHSLKPTTAKPEPTVHKPSATNTNTLIPTLQSATEVPTTLQRLPASQRSTAVLGLQAQHGNQHVQRVLQRKQATAVASTAFAPTIQRKGPQEAEVQAIITQNPALQALATSINTLADSKSQETKEPGKASHKSTTNNIAELREQIAAMNGTTLGVSEGNAHAVQAYLYTQLAKAAPFYSQMNNENILGTKKQTAAYRTCNLTTVSMCLEGLGKTVADFNGNMTLMDNIVSQLSGLGTSAASLRFPDFMQITAIYIMMVGKGDAGALNSLAKSDPTEFKVKMDAGAVKASNSIASSELFDDYTKFFGIPVSKVTHPFNESLAVIGAYYRSFEGDFKDYKKDNASLLKKLGEDGLREKFTAERKAKAKKQGDSLNKKIATGADIAATGEQIAVIDQWLTDYPTNAQTLDQKVVGLEGQLAALEEQIKATTDKTAKAELKKQKTKLKAQKSAAKKERTTLDKDKKKQEKARKKLAKAKSDQEGNIQKQNAYYAVGSSQEEEGAKVEAALPIAQYRQSVLPVMQEALGSGKQVIVNLHNHFVKLQALDESMVVVHDPGGTERGNKQVTWEQARELGYFKRYTVVG